MRTLLGLTFGMVMIVPVPAAAQLAPSFEDLPLRLGDAIVVRDQSGREVSGRLVGMTSNEIVIERLGGRAPFTRQNVWRISRPRDPLWDAS